VSPSASAFCCRAGPSSRHSHVAFIRPGSIPWAGHAAWQRQVQIVTYAIAPRRIVIVPAEPMC
jgi:hypothetical protein